MSFALESVKQIQATYKEMVEMERKLREKQSKYDKRLSEIYHEIETAGDVDMVEAFEFFKTLQVTLQTRRRVKHEQSALDLAIREIKPLTDQVNRTRNTLQSRAAENERYRENFEG